MVVALSGCAQFAVKQKAVSCSDNASCTQGIEAQTLLGKAPADLTPADLPGEVMALMRQPCTLLLDYGEINVVGPANGSRLVTWTIDAKRLANPRLAIALVFAEKDGIVFTDQAQTDFVSPKRVSDTVFTWTAATPGTRKILSYGINLDVRITPPSSPPMLYKCHPDPTIVNSL